MNDAEFLTAFENCTLPPSEFGHRNHIRAAWLYLRSGSVLEALERFAGTLRRYARSLGKEHIYHETITWAYLFIIHERMMSAPAGSSFDEFAAGNADLFDWPLERSVIARYYRADTLASDRARRAYLMPDRAPAQV